jgi:hypothetical protein
MNIKIIFIFVFVVLITTTLYSQKKVYTITNVNEFYNSIGPDRILELEPGTYYISEITVEKENPYVSFNQEYDGNELVISNVKKLTIKGTGTKPSKIITKPVYGDVLVFDGCNDINIENIEAGHGPEPGGCTGGVLHFISTDKIIITGCILYGSGTEGITAENVNNLTCRESIIKNCTYGIMTLTNCLNINFTDCDFKNNKEFDLINITSSKNVKFDECVINNNTTGIESYSDYCLFNLSDCENIQLTSSDIRNNKTCYFATETVEFKISKTEMYNNNFVKGKFKKDKNRYK